MNKYQLVLPAPFDQQQAVIDGNAHYKLVRKGRRGGGSQAALHCAIAGHGGAHQFRGMLGGGHVIWVGPTYKQVDEVWRTQISPRFQKMKGARVFQSDMRVELFGGKLECVANENNAIEVIRGRGPDGVVFDECAHFDLEYAWLSVVSPALLTNDGWCVFASSTNAGEDGNTERIMPSYFNRMCATYWNEPLPEGVERPILTERWQGFHWRTDENPRLSPAAVQEVYARLGGKGSVRAQEELDALLILGAAGKAFPEWDEAVHVVKDREPPRSWKYYGSLDWGFAQGSYHLYACDSEGNLEAVWEFYDRFTSMHAKQAARAIFEASQYLPIPDIVYHDDQMLQHTGVDEDMTLLTQFLEGLDDVFGSDEAPVLLPAAKGPGSRVMKFNMTHRFLAMQGQKTQQGDWPRDERGIIQPWARPKLRVQERCRALRRTLQGIPSDPRDPEDVDQHWIGGDHAYDDLGNILLSRFKPPETLEPAWNENVHPGIGPNGRRRRRGMTLAQEAQEEFAGVEYAYVREAPRWHTPYRGEDPDEEYEG